MDNRVLSAAKDTPVVSSKYKHFWTQVLADFVVSEMGQTMSSCYSVSGLQNVHRILSLKKIGQSLCVITDNSFKVGHCSNSTLTFTENRITKTRGKS